MNGNPVTAPARPMRGEVLLFTLAAVAIPLAYILVTHHVWEDYLITFRFSRNLCEGHGLVYNLGERVYGFTSPLGTLVPAAGYWITGGASYVDALWLLRVVSVAGFVAGGLLLLVAMRFDQPDWLPRLFFACLYLLEIKSVAFTTNGQETAFMLCFLAWGLYLIQVQDPAHALARGLCWAGLMWTRPDGCIAIAGLALATLLFARQPRKFLLRSLATSALIAAVLYLPWFVGVWIYYGTPIPHTIIAKSTYVDPKYIYYLRRLPFLFPGQLRGVLAGLFTPIYWGHPGWPDWLGDVSLAVGVLAGLYWLCPLPDRLGRAASFCFFILALYYGTVPTLFPWYFPPLGMAAALALVRAAFTLAQRAGRAAPIARALAVLLLTAWTVETLGILVLSTWQMKVRQEVIETDHRARIGEWLRTRVDPRERVYTESLGYIGFFSDARMLDYPGLVSPEVVRLRREQNLDLVTLIPELQPEWLVLRPTDLPLPPRARDHYHIVKQFNATEALDRQGYIPGRGYLDYDAAYVVLKRDRPIH